MTLVRGQGRPVQRDQASKTPTGPFSSNKSDNRDHKDPLGSNEPGPSKAPAGSKALAGSEIPAGPEVPPESS